MKSYALKIFDREEGPYSETQVAQMFADGRVNRDTPCKLADGAMWKTVDEYLPMLKYGTQLPPPTVAISKPAPNQVVTSTPQRVAVVDLDMPFGSVLKIMFKWMAAAFIIFCCFIPVIAIIGFVLMALFAAMVGGAMSNGHH